MRVPCPLCATPLSSDGADRFCIYCNQLFNKMPVVRNNNFVSHSFFYNRRGPHRCNLTLDFIKGSLDVKKNDASLLNGIDYSVSEEDGALFVTFLRIPEDGDYITVSGEIKSEC